MPLNYTWMREKIVASKKYLALLQKFLKETKSISPSDLDSQVKAERIFEILSQVLLDLCTHIVSNTAQSIPQSYSDCMYALAGVGVISKELADKSANMVKMRNIIAHQYNNINYSLLLAGLRELERDFPIFQAEILNWINLKEKEQKELA